jgi:transposase-like protein
MDALTWFRKQVDAADADLLRELTTSFAGALMSAEVDALCGAGFGERSPERALRRLLSETRDESVFQAV